MNQFFFSSWDALLRTLVVGTLAWVALVAILRVSGKRTLSKWNAFDFIVTIALGSTLATALLSRQVRLAEGVLALALLVLLQFCATWVNTHWPVTQKAVKAKPRLLVYRGEYLREAMRKERVPETEIHTALRNQGLASIKDVGAVILETDGSFSLIRDLGENRDALTDVDGIPS